MDVAHQLAQVAASISSRDFITFVSGLGAGSMTTALLTHRLGRNAKRADARLEADRKLFEKLIAELPFDGTVDYLMSHSMASGLPLRVYERVNDFYHRWKEPLHSFYDAKLEKARAKLHAATTDFVFFIDGETFRMDGERQGAPVEWKETQPKRRVDVVDGMQEKARTVADAHQALLLTAKARLHI